MKEYLARLFRYMAWADRRSLEALRAASAAQAEGVPLLSHLLAAEHVWLARLEGREPRFAVWPTLSLDACEILATDNESGYRAYGERLSEGDLAGAIRYRTSQGQEYTTPVIDVLTQVITHGPYHRGQIAKILGRLGGKAINTDFITFARETDTASSVQLGN